MKKKVVSALLCATMVATMFAGCGSKESDNNASTPDTSKADTSSEVSEPAEDTGKVLNIYCWNEEFKSRITAHYPDYKEVDATHGKIGDVDVVWNITPNDDNAYQNNLDATLLNQADAPADDKIDLFLVEADYALKYVDTDYTMPIKDLGITDDDLSKQYQYTKDIVMFFGRSFGQWLEPVGVMSCSHFCGPAFHAFGNLVGNAAVECGAVVYGVGEFVVHVGGKVFEHLLAVEHILCKVFRRAFAR